MNQAVLFNFALQRDQRVYQLSLQPGAPWEEIYGVLDEFKLEMQKLEEETKKLEAQKAEITPEAEKTV